MLHFSPIELYPPAANFLNFMARDSRELECYVISSRCHLASKKDFIASSGNIHLIRTGTSFFANSRFGRLCNYISFYANSLFLILWHRPSAVLYFETLSCLPAYLYRFLFNRKIDLLVHYHEYVSTAEFVSGSRFFRFLWSLEKKLIRHASWISHTNEERLKLFCNDYGIKMSHVCKVLPNYPPASWLNTEILNVINSPVRLVYVGALGNETMYLQEFAAWVMRNSGKVTWDIFSVNPDADAVSLLDSINADNISFKGSVEYEELPTILRTYDVGLILYKGHIPNYINNAPNKLFEYHVSGLDVWFPSVMKGCFPYITSGSYPKVMAVDFEDLEKWHLNTAIDRNGLAMKLHHYSYEKVFPELLNALSLKKLK